MRFAFTARGAILDSRGTLWCDLDSLDRVVEPPGAAELHYHSGDLDVVCVLDLKKYGIRRVRQFYASHN